MYHMTSRDAPGDSPDKNHEVVTRPPHTVHPVSRAGHLDSGFRRVLYRPDRLAGKYIQPGDRVLDFGCGPGFFTREFARRVGENGTVYAVDLQEGMLDLLRKKLGPEGLLPRIHAHQCKPDSINLPADLAGTFDVAFAIFVVHEVPDPGHLFREIASLLKTGGTFFYSEPPIVVSGREFADHLAEAEEAGFTQTSRSLYFVNRAALFVKK